MTLQPITEKWQMVSAITEVATKFSFMQDEQVYVCGRCGAIVPANTWLYSASTNALDAHAQWHLFIERASFIFGSQSS
jgi:epoxyqueuosine reductase QueG